MMIFKSARAKASDAGAGAPGEPGLPVLPPRNAIIELALFFLAVMALEWGFSSFPDLNELQPHPFWLPVLLLTLQYGTVSGLFAAGVAILFTAFIGWPEPDVNEEIFNYRLRIWTQPVLWIGAALMLGQLRMRQIADSHELQSRVVELEKERVAISEFSKNLRGRCEALERRIAGRRDPDAIAVLNALALLRADEPSALASGIARCADAALGGGQCSVFALRDGCLKLATSHGWEAGAPWRSVIAGDEDLYRAMTEQVRGLSVLDGDDEAALNGQGLAAVPVLSMAGDRVLGMLKVEQMAPEQLDGATLGRLSVIASQIGPSLELHGEDGIGAGEPASQSAFAAAGRARKPARAAEHRHEPASAADVEGTAAIPVLKAPKVVR